MNTRKETLRRKLFAERLALDPIEVNSKSHKITQKLLEAVDWPSAQNLHIYSSEPSWKEVDTKYIKEIIHRRWPHIKLTSPPPNKDEPLPSEQFDLIIVPVLGFDTDNYRLGLGGGWYDRFLATQRHAYTIGLAYGLAQIASLPHEKHDISLDKVITDL